MTPATIELLERVAAVYGCRPKDYLGFPLVAELGYSSLDATYANFYSASLWRCCLMDECRNRKWSVWMDPSDDSDDLLCTVLYGHGHIGRSLNPDPLTALAECMLAVPESARGNPAPGAGEEVKSGE